MNTKKPCKYNINQDFLVLSPDKQVTIETNDDTLYQRLDSVYNGFSGHELISCHRFERDWLNWEIHPKGDEIVILLQGAATMVLQEDAGDNAITLEQPGEYVVIPKNTWHTAKISQYAQMLFITPGEGTENK